MRLTGEDNARPLSLAGEGDAARGKPSGRTTRRQKARSIEEAADAERLQEAGTDRRGGWRASKAKATRRNRRYENRLLSSVSGLGVDETLE